MLTAQIKHNDYCHEVIVVAVAVDGNYNGYLKRIHSGLQVPNI